MSIQPTKFEIQFSAEDIADLKRRLSQTRLPDTELLPLLQGWDYGTNLPWLRAMVSRWQHDFDFQKFQNEITRWPHFRAEIEGMNIHFMHIRSLSPNAIPLLLVHGWPGSFLEFKHLLEPLTNPEAVSSPAFHVVVPSLPGYAYSETPSMRGWTMEDNARVLNKLMVGLGYDQYMAQGGDWGHQVCRYLGSLYTQNCKMVHLNMLPGPPPKLYSLLCYPWIPKSLSNALRSYLYTPVANFLCQRNLDFSISGAGYAQIQGTRPATIGYALLDTPVGHLCWLGDKWYNWSDTSSPSLKLFSEHNDSGLLMSDDILANVSLYWFTKTILSSFIPYLENRDARYKDYRILNLTNTMEKKYWISVPMGVSNFKHDLAGTTRGVVAKSGDLRFYHEHDFGGHFAALDRPQALLEDIQAFARENVKAAFYSDRNH